jgi:hypothetical protein
MSNKYGGTCYKCGEHCEPGAGVFERVSHVQRKKWPALPRTAKWLTQHHDCVRGYPSDTHFEYNPSKAKAG